jgi:hypothetical protein
MNVPRRKRLIVALAAAGATAMLMTQGACVDGRQFRTAALPALKGGVDLMLDGVVDGLFAAIAVETPPGTGDTSSTTP